METTMHDIINKIASTVEMSFDIPESEKEEARKTSEEFSKVLGTLEQAKKHLNYMYEPFSSAEVTPEALHEYRGTIKRYKDQIKENFNKVKTDSFLAVSHLKNFGSDTHVTELVSSFEGSLSDLEKQVVVLLNVLDDLKSKDIKNNIVKSIEEILKNSFEIEKIIKERIIDFIDSNILAKDWTSDIGEELKSQIKEKVPYITQLFKERQEALE